MDTPQLNIDNLLTPIQFIRESGLDLGDFYRLNEEGRVQGTIMIAGKLFIDRSQVNISYQQNGYKFKIWKDLGGRAVPVSVPKYLKDNSKVVNGGELSPPGSNG
jgi:hypothetical protein